MTAKSKTATKAKPPGDTAKIVSGTLPTTMTPSAPLAKRDPAVVGARVCFSPVILNTVTAMTFTGNNPVAKNGHDGTETLDVSACADVMVDKVNALAKGDTSQIEQHLLCQAVALEAIFTEMARRAALNMGKYLGPTETYMRLALKAQAQCRSTLETLAEIKNPRPIFINPKQVNHSTGSQQINNAEGPQQVNNGSSPASSPREQQNYKAKNKLLGSE